MNKFIRLYSYLTGKSDEEIKLTFEEIEEIIGSSLPASATKHQSYFSNTETHAIYKAWDNAGYYVSKVNIGERYIILKRKSNKTHILLGTDVFIDILKNDSAFEGELFISVFALAEAILYKGIIEKDAETCINHNHITIIDYQFKIITFNAFISRINSISVVLRNFYNSFIKYSLLNALTNSLPNDTKAILDYFTEENANYLIINFPFANSLYAQIVFESELKKLLLKMNINKDYNEIVSAIGYLKFHEMDLIPCSGLEYRQINYLNYSVKQFVDSCSKGKPFLPTYLVLEMINVDIIASKNELIYYTKYSDNEKILISSLATKVFIR